MACNVKVGDFPNLMEKSIFNYFPRIVYTYWNYIRRWCALTQYFKPVCANAFGFPVLLLVPSGKITAER
jgi:hypothetical protein